MHRKDRWGEMETGARMGSGLAIAHYNLADKRTVLDAEHVVPHRGKEETGQGDTENSECGMRIAEWGRIIGEVSTTHVHQTRHFSAK